MASQLLGIKTRFTNDLGSPLVGGQVYTFFAGTSTPQDTYSDAELTVPNTNPVILDDTGSADIFLKGSYRIRVFDASGRFIEEQDNVTQAATQGDATELSGKVTTIEGDLNKVKFDTGITATAKFGGSVRPLSDKLSESLSITDFGSASDISAYTTANASGKYITIPDGVYTVSANTADEAKSLIEILPKIVDCKGVLRFVLGSHKILLTQGLYIKHCLANVSVSGASINKQLTGIASVTAGTFNIKHWDSVFKDLPYHTITYILDNTDGVEVGDYVIAKDFSGVGGSRHSGVWEVTAVAGNKINVLTTLQSAPPTSGITGSITVLKTVISFGNSGVGFSALVAEQGGHLGEINDLAFVGTCRPLASGNRTPANYDVAGGAGGVTGIIARDGSSLRFGSSFGINGFSGTNATSNRCGSILTTGVSSNAARNGWSAAGASLTQADGAVASGNLIDGFISQDGSFNFAKRGVTVGNHRHGVISAGNGSVNFDAGYSCGNGGDGFNLILSTGSGVGATFSGNTGYGIRAINNSTIRASAVAIQDNTKSGIEAYGSNVAADGGTINGNLATDIIAKARSTISIIGKVGMPTTNISINSTSADLSYIQDTSTLSVTRLSEGLAVGSSGNTVASVYAKRVTTVGFDPIPANSSKTTAVTVAGVNSAKNNVVVVSRDSTAIRSGIIYKGVVSATNQVTISANNVTTTTATLPNENFNIMVFEL